MAINGAIQSDRIRAEVMRHLEDYTAEVGRVAEEGAEKYAKLGARLLKTSSPDLTGSYRKGWRAKRVGSRWVIHNATDYQLTHLLEHGHVSRNGTQRTFGDVGQKVHIRPVEERMVDEFVKEIERVINNR